MTERTLIFCLSIFGALGGGAALLGFCFLRGALRGMATINDDRFSESAKSVKQARGDAERLGAEFEDRINKLPRPPTLQEILRGLMGKDVLTGLLAKLADITRPVAVPAGPPTALDADAVGRLERRIAELEERFPAGWRACPPHRDAFPPLPPTSPAAPWPGEDEATVEEDGPPRSVDPAASVEGSAIAPAEMAVASGGDRITPTGEEDRTTPAHVGKRPIPAREEEPTSVFDRMQELPWAEGHAPPPPALEWHGEPTGRVTVLSRAAPANRAVLAPINAPRARAAEGPAEGNRAPQGPLPAVVPPPKAPRVVPPPTPSDPATAVMTRDALPLPPPAVGARRSVRIPAPAVAPPAPDEPDRGPASSNRTGRTIAGPGDMSPELIEAVQRLRAGGSVGPE